MFGVIPFKMNRVDKEEDVFDNFLSEFFNDDFERSNSNR